MMNITESTTVAEIVSALPSSVRVFQRYDIDFCCGGKRPLAAVCEQKGVSLPELVKEIEIVARTPDADARDWTTAPLPDLIDHIVATYHVPLREELPRLEAMSAKVSRVHGAKAPHLARLEAIVAELSDDLRSHMHREELVLFPAIRTIAQGTGAPGMRIGAPIMVMESEHDRAGALISELRALTDGYTPPDWACETFRALYLGLAEFEAAMHVHVHLENNILFPRALASADVGNSSQEREEIRSCSLDSR